MLGLPREQKQKIDRERHHARRQTDRLLSRRQALAATAGGVLAAPAIVRAQAPLAVRFVSSSRASSIFRSTSW